MSVKPDLTINELDRAIDENIQTLSCQWTDALSTDDATSAVEALKRMRETVSKIQNDIADSIRVRGGLQ